MRQDILPRQISLEGACFVANDIDQAPNKETRVQKPSAILRYIEAQQGERPWGRFLDAGTGLKSLRWVAGLDTASWTAVTGASGDADIVAAGIKSTRREDDRVLLGNWADASFLKGEVFDTVLADYLLGAIEGFAPCFQPYLFARLRPHTRQRLYVVGVEPYVPTGTPKSEAARLIWQIGRYRDACLLHAGEMPYREYPAQWVVDHLQRAGFNVRALKRFKNLYGATFVNSQIDLCKPRLDATVDDNLAAALRQRGEDLRSAALGVIDAQGPLQVGEDYVITADSL